MPPDNGLGWKDASAAPWAVGIHIHHIPSLKSGHVSGNEKNVSGFIVAAGEFTGIRFGLPGVGRLEIGKSFFAGDTGIEEKGRSLRVHDLAYPKLPETDVEQLGGARFEIHHQFGIHSQRKVGISRGNGRELSAGTMEETIARIESSLQGRCPRICGGGKDAERPRRGVVPDFTADGKRGHLPGIDAVEYRFLREFVVMVFRIKVHALPPLPEFTDAGDTLAGDFSARRSDSNQGGEDGDNRHYDEQLDEGERGRVEQSGSGFHGSKEASAPSLVKVACRSFSLEARIRAGASKMV